MTDRKIQDMKPQELLKMFVNDVGVLIDARLRTAEITIKASTDASIKASEERLTKRIEALEQKVDKGIEDQEKQIKHIEEHVGLSPRN
jgi:hypothetical protein